MLKLILMNISNVIINTGSVAASATGLTGNLSDFSVGLILLFFGLLFFFAVDIIFLLSRMGKGYKRPKIDFFRIFGVIELLLSAYFFARAF